MTTRASGGIGRRTGFRFQRRKAWGFKSLLAHEVVNARESETAPGDREGVGLGGDVSGDDSKVPAVRDHAVATLAAALQQLIKVGDAKGAEVVLDALWQFSRLQAASFG